MLLLLLLLLLSLVSIRSWLRCPAQILITKATSHMIPLAPQGSVSSLVTRCPFVVSGIVCLRGKGEGCRGDPHERERARRNRLTEFVN